VPIDLCSPPAKRAQQPAAGLGASALGHSLGTYDGAEEAARAHDAAAVKQGSSHRTLRKPSYTSRSASAMGPRTRAGG
jgi:hypothetical protein